MADDAEETLTLDWDKLRAPVPQEDLEWVEKMHGKKFAYMTAQFVRRRLDSVAQGRWTYDCEHIPFVQGQPAAGDGEPFVVKGVLSIGKYGWVSRSSFGSGKNFKEAETDAFKRAAQRLGIGNELYEMDPVGGAPVASKPTAQAAHRGTAAPVDSPLAGAAPRCPKCQGPMWDNRVGKTNPKAPDFKCKKKGECDGAIWQPKEVTKESIQRSLDEDDDLPY